MTVYYVYKNGVLHTKVWSVPSFIENLKAYHDDVKRLKTYNDEYMRLRADNHLYTVYARFKGLNT